jgi:hypothetical protein
MYILIIQKKIKPNQQKLLTMNFLHTSVINFKKNPELLIIKLFVNEVNNIWCWLCIISFIELFLI